MDDPDSENESLEASVEELENKVERLEEQSTGRNQIQMQAYDIRVQASSEDSGMDELAEICSEQIDEMMRTSMMAEYQELEERNMFDVLLGDD